MNFLTDVYQNNFWTELLGSISRFLQMETSSTPTQTYLLSKRTNCFPIRGNFVKDVDSRIEQIGNFQKTDQTFSGEYSFHKSTENSALPESDSKKKSCNKFLITKLRLISTGFRTDTPLLMS